MGKFVVPKEQQHAYKMLVQRANRRVKANLKYIKTNNITSMDTQRSLVSSFTDHTQWAGKTMPFSRSIKGRWLTNADTGAMEFKDFANEREFKQYLKHLEKWGKEGKRFDASPRKIKEDYKTSIIKALNNIKDQYNITLPGGKLPKEIITAINSMTLQEITNFYANGDPGEDMEIAQFDSDDFVLVETAEDFIDVVVTRVNNIKKYY